MNGISGLFITINKNKKQLAEQKAEISQLKEKLAAEKENAQNLANKIETLEEENRENLQNKLADLEESSKQMETALASQTQNYEKEKAIANRLKSAIKGHEAKAGEALTEKLGLENDLAVAKKEIDDLKAKLQNSENLGKMISTNEKKLKKKIEDQQNNMALLREMLDHAKMGLVGAQDSTEGANTVAAANKEKNEKLEKENEALKKQLFETEEKSKAKMKKMKQDAADERKKAKTEYEDEMVRKCQEIEKEQNNVAKLATELEKAKKELEKGKKPHFYNLLKFKFRERKNPNFCRVGKERKW